jgi:hypothetical protein
VLVFLKCAKGIDHSKFFEYKKQLRKSTRSDGYDHNNLYLNEGLYFFKCFSIYYKLLCDYIFNCINLLVYHNKSIKHLKDASIFSKGILLEIRS